MRARGRHASPADQTTLRSAGGRPPPASASHHRGAPDIPVDRGRTRATTTCAF